MTALLNRGVPPTGGTTVPLHRPTLYLITGATPVSYLDVVIPAYNEEQRIGPTLTGLARSLADAGVSAHILVVDNGSVDGTVEMALGARTDDVPIHVVNCRHRGKGAAVRAGVASATAPYVAYLDADGSTPPAALLTALDLLHRGWDAVIGSRRALGGRYVVPQPAVRRIGSLAFHLAASGIVGRVSDTQCGMKAFRTAAVQPIFAATTTTGFAFDVEVLARAQASGLRLMELPVEWSDAGGSTFSPLRDGLAAFRDLAEVRRATRTLTRQS